MASDELQAGDPSTESRDDGDLTPGVVFGILADEKHRLILHLLRDRGGTTAVDELAARLVAYQAETGADLLPTESERGVATYLHLVVLPDLAAHEMVTYDPDDRAVTIASGSDRIEPYLEFAKEREPPAVIRFVERCRRTEE